MNLDREVDLEKTEQREVDLPFTRQRHVEVLASAALPEESAAPGAGARGPPAWPFLVVLGLVGEGTKRFVVVWDKSRVLCRTT